MKIAKTRLIEKQGELLNIPERFRDTCVYIARGNLSRGDDEGYRLSMLSAEMTEGTIAYLTNRAPRDLCKEERDRRETLRANATAKRRKKGGAL